MRFWDSSAVVPLLVAETQSKRRLLQLKEDETMLVSWGTSVECMSAIQRLVRDKALSAKAAVAAEARIRELESVWIEVEPTSPVRLQAHRLLRIHPLRAGNALQLAAAVVASGNDPTSLPFVSSDVRLLEAAAKEGFRVIE